ncbi:MAG: hypothetical protein QFB89_03910 [Pseudomonadota bacterium]|nr:hypothetical protein [Pseudomonadota bacterium]
MDDQVFPPRRLAGAKRHFLDDPVALVEHAQNRHPVGHWGDPDIAAFGRRGRSATVLGLLMTAPAGAERGDAAEQEENRPAHVYSGIQGS